MMTQIQVIYASKTLLLVKQLKTIMEKDKELVRLSRTANDQGLVDVSRLSEAEKKRCREITRSIKDLETLTAFGSDIANARNEATHQLMEVSKVDKAGEVGGLVKKVVEAIRDTEYKDVESMKGVRGFIARYIPFGTTLVKKSDQYLIDKFYSAKDVVDKVVEELVTQQVNMKSDSNTLEHMLQKTKSYVDQLGVHYVALAQFKEDLEVELRKMKEDNEKVPGTWSDFQIAEKKAFIEEVEHRSYDIFITGQYNANVLIPSINKMKDNAVRLARNADEIVKTVIPNWEHSIAMALINQREKEAIEIQKAVRDKNNELVKSTAKMMKDITISIEKESRRGMIDVEAYKEAFATTTEALLESQKAFIEAKEKRAKDMEEIAKFNKEMVEKFKEMSEETRKFYLDDDNIQTAKALR